MYHLDAKSRYTTWAVLITGVFSFGMVISCIFVENEKHQSDWEIMFFEMLLLSVAYWLWREARRKDQINAIISVNKYIASWRRGIALLFFITGLQGIFIAAHIHNPLLIQSIPTHLNSSDNNSTPITSPEKQVDNKSDALPEKQVNNKSEGLQTLLLTFMGIIIAVASAYYLVTLQGTWKQAKELLDKLENQKIEMDRLKYELNNLRQHEFDIMIALGGFANFLSEHITTEEKYKIKILARSTIMGHVLEINEKTTHVSLNKKQTLGYLVDISNGLKELYRCLAITPKEIENETDPNEKKKLTEYRHCIAYLPDSLLRKIRQNVEQLDYNALPPEEKEYINSTLKYTGKLERLIRDRMERDW